MGLSNVEDILQAGLEGTDMPKPESRIAELLKEWIEQGGNIDDILVAGANITLTKNADGTITISATGDVSSEDIVAREAIAAIKDGQTLDSFGDVETVLEDKADKATTYTKSEVDELVDSIDIPTTLAELTDDATHRVVTDTEKATWNAKADAADIPTVPVKGVAKNGTAITPDASGVVNITIPSTAADVSALPDTTLYGASISLSINTTTYVVTVTLKDQNGDTLGTAQTIDLPLESVVVGGSYNDTTKKVVLTLQSGSTVEFSVADLVAGLQSEITSTNKLDADLVDDSTSTNKFVSSAEKSAWNDKQSAITNSNKLSSDLVDDTNNTHKFATAAQLAQIATNASDISDIQTTIGNINSVLEEVL